jgi:hypothetical protein
MSTPHVDDASEVQPSAATQYSVDLDRGEKPPAGFVRGRTVVLACAVFVVGLLGLNLFSTLEGNKRNTVKVNDAVTLWSAKTAHSFEQTPTGIIETFVAASPGDTATVDSIRRTTEALLLTRRNVGDFSVNGKKNLVGREELEQSTIDLRISREEVDNGVTFTYSTDKPELQKALKTWASSQQE